MLRVTSILLKSAVLALATPGRRRNRVRSGIVTVTAIAAFAAGSYKQRRQIRARARFRAMSRFRERRLR
jgi:hypothetical protein